MNQIETNELDYWKEREEKIERFLNETDYLPLPEDLRQEIRSKLSNEVTICAEQEEQIQNGN